MFLCKKDHDEHSDDDALPKRVKGAKKKNTYRGSKYVQDISPSKQPVKESHTTSFIQQQHKYDGWSKIPKINEDEVIYKEASPWFLEELKSMGEKKVPTITDHHIMEATLNDTMRNQYKIASMKERSDLKEVYSDHKSDKVIKNESKK
nr:hypothetical protein [Tanacetum cinerariifolium]